MISQKKCDSFSRCIVEVNRQAKTKILFTADVVASYSFIITIQTKQLLTELCSVSEMHTTNPFLIFLKFMVWTLHNFINGVFVTESSLLQ